MKLNKLNKKLIIINLIFIYLFIYRFFIVTKYLSLSEGITSSFTIILAAISIKLFGYKKIKNNELSSDFIKTTLIMIIIYFACIYGFGLVVGFLLNSYSTKLLGIIDNIYNIVPMIIATEIFRYVFINAKENNKNNGYIYVITFLLTLLESNLYMSNSAFNDLTSSFKFITLIFLPILAKNILCSYITYHSDYRISLLYRLIMDLYIYIVPIQPDLGDYFNSITSIMLPYMLLVNLSRTKSQSIEKLINSKSKNIIIKKSDIPLIIGIVAMAFIIVGIGPFKLIGIETGSMQPTIKIGDAAFINKLYNKEKLKEGDIIAYKTKDNLTIVHRIYKINKDSSIITKGDYNNSADSIYVNKEQIEGKVLFKIPFIAYPAIYFRK